MDNVEPKSESTLNPTVVKLGLVSFFADIASEMLYPITPIFLTTILGASMASVGLIEGIAEATASLLKTFSGNWSDAISKRKPFILVGYFLGTISKPFIGLSTSWSQVLLARMLDRTGKGLRSAPRDALLAESVPIEKRGAAFGWHRSMDTMGAAIGPLFALYLLSKNPSDLRNIYFWALLPGFLSVLFVLLVKEKSRSSLVKKKSINLVMNWKALNPEFKKYLFIWAIFSIGNSSDIFLLMKAKSVGVSLQQVVLFYCFYNLTYSLSSPYLGKLSDRINRKWVLLFGLFVFALVYLGFAFTEDVVLFWFLFGIYGLYMGATDGVGKALAIDLISSDRKASGLGILGTVTGLCTIIASYSAGIMWDNWGSAWTFYFGAAASLLAAFMLSCQKIKSVHRS